MREGYTALGHLARGLLVAAMLAAAQPVAAANPVVQPPFADDYFVVALGEIPGVHAPYGAINFGLGTANQVIVAGSSGTVNALIHEIDLTRDVTGSISGFDGTASVLTEAYAVGAGAAYGPDDVLFYSRVTWEMGEVKYESTTADKIVKFSNASMYRPSGLNFVPLGFPGAGQLKMTTFNVDGPWWSLDIEPDGMGTYDVTGATKGPALPGYPEGFTYVPDGLPGFPSPSVVVCEYANAYGIGKLTAYDIDANGNPVLATRREIVTGLDVPYGITIDPTTGDLLWTSYQGFAYLLRKAPLPPTTTTTTTIPTTTTTSTTKPTTTTTSTTLRPTTTSTVAPPTTTSSTSSSTTKPPTTSTSTTIPPTTTSTTAAPTTSTSTSTSTTKPTTSTTRPTTTSTAAPTTTSTSTTSSTTKPPTTSTSTTAPPTTTSTTLRPTTTTTTTPTTSSTVTTSTIPPVCTAEPSFPSIACRIETLLDLVRAAAVLGPLQPGFVARFERAQQIVADGSTQCAAGERTLAREALVRVERQMLVIRTRTRTHRARKIIPPALAATIANGARSIGADADALRGDLTCP